MTEMPQYPCPDCKQHPLAEALLQENIDVFEKLLRKNNDNLNDVKVKLTTQLEYGRKIKHEAEHCCDVEESLLQRAARMNSIDAVKLLLSHGISAKHGRQTNSDMPCALHWAAKNRNRHLIQELLLHGEDVDCFYRGQTCLLNAVKNRDLEMAQVFISCGANLGQRFVSAGSIYEIAIQDGNWRMLQELVGAGLYLRANTVILIMEYMDRNVLDFFRLATGLTHWSTLPLDSCARLRVDIRNKLMKHSKGCSILPAIAILPVSWGWKYYLSFGLIHRPQNLKEMCRTVVRGQLHLHDPKHMTLLCNSLPLPHAMKIYILDGG